MLKQTDKFIDNDNLRIAKIIKKLYTQPFDLKTLAKNLETIILKKPLNFQIRNNHFEWNKTYIMGILNVTPNSFSDGGEFFDEKNCISHFEKLISDRETENLKNKFYDELARDRMENNKKINEMEGTLKSMLEDFKAFVQESIIPSSSTS